MGRSIKSDCPAARAFPSVEEFESATLDPSIFDHQAHIFVAWGMLQQNSPAQATERFLKALKRLTRKLGAESKYHETISSFYLAVIAERCASRPGQDWQAFVRTNPDLFEPPKVFLERHYSPERIWSNLARRQFLLPDRALVAVNDGSI